MSEPQYDRRVSTFIGNLNGLDASDRARLKRSAGKPLDEATHNLGLFYRLLPYGGVPATQEPKYWLVASLYPLTGATVGGSFGSALRRARSAQYKKGLDRRVEALLDSDETQLAYRLGQAVRFLHSHRVPINWQGLLVDLLQWDHSDRFVQKKWAKAYFALPDKQPDQPTSQDSSTQENG